LQSPLHIVAASLVLITVDQPRPRASPIPLAAPRVSNQDCRDCWVTFNPVESGTATVGEHRPGRPPGIRCTVRLAQFSRAAPCARCSCSFRVQPLAHAIAPRSSRAPSHRGGVGGGPWSRRARIDVPCKPSFLHRGISGILFLPLAVFIFCALTQLRVFEFPGLRSPSVGWPPPGGHPRGSAELGGIAQTVYIP
jgi:hypothetical protein